MMIDIVNDKEDLANAEDRTKLNAKQFCQIDVARLWELFLHQYGKTFVLWELH